MSYRSWVLHVSIPVAAMQPARPRMDKRKPTSWYVVVDMAFASGTLAAALEPALPSSCGRCGPTVLLRGAALIRWFLSAPGVCSQCFP